MPSASDKVVLEIGLDSKKVPKGIKELQKRFEELSKKLEKINASITKGFKSQEESLKKISEASKQSADAVAKAEKQKSDAIGKSNKVIDEQEKKLTRLQKTAQKLKSTARGIGRGIGGGIIGGAAGLAGFMMGGMQQSIAAYQQYGMAQRGLTGTGITRRQLGRAGGAGVGMGYTLSETAQQALGVGRAVGRGAEVTTAQQFGYAGGMGVGEAAGVMGALYKGGVGFGGKEKQGQKELSKIITAGMESGLDRGKIPEFAQSVSQMVDQMSARGVGRADVGGAAGGLGWLMKGLGFKSPERAMQVAQGLDVGIRAPGGGEAGQAMMLQAFGFGKPGGTADIYEATKRQQQGFFGTGGTKNVQDVLSEFARQYGEVGVGGKTESMKMANFMASKVLPLTIDQIEQLQEINNTTETQAEKDKKIEELMKKAEPLEKQMLDQTKKGFTGVAKQVAKVNSVLVKVGAKYWSVATRVQNKMLKVMDVLSGPLATGLGKLVDAIDRLIDSIGYLWSWLKEKFGGTSSATIAQEKLRKMTGGSQATMVSNVGAWQASQEKILKGITPATAEEALAQKFGMSMAATEVRRQQFTDAGAKATEKRRWFKSQEKINAIMSRVQRGVGEAGGRFDPSQAMAPEAMSLFKNIISKKAPTNAEIAEFSKKYVSSRGKIPSRSKEQREALEAGTSALPPGITRKSISAMKEMTDWLKENVKALKEKNEKQVANVRQISGGMAPAGGKTK
jgi:hypothetical protein